MTDLSTTYMGVKLANPIIVGACGLTSKAASIKALEDAGAGAIVTKSLFEEQVQVERFKFDEDLEKYNYRNAEMVEIFPNTTYEGPKEHLMWVSEAKKSVKIPVFASLNAVNRDTWIEYAKLLEETGVDGLEVNLFAPPGDLRTGSDLIERSQVELVMELKRTVSIPISVKLSSSYANVLNLITLMDYTGVDAFVLFNKMFTPDIDLQKNALSSPISFSSETDSRIPLRYAALLEGAVRADICCSTGIMDGEQVLKMILAGATTVQVVSTLYRHGMSHITAMLGNMEKWMEANGHTTLADFRGKLSKQNVAELWAYTRTQYVKIMMNPDEIIKNAPVI
jgi:dihydroorotate dehydrogenase (fumarate)